MENARPAMPLSVEKVEALLPHRYPFLLVDRVTDHEPGRWAKGIKCVSANEPFFAGHFPQKKIMPGVLILEAMAQVGAVALLSEPGNAGKIVLFGGVKNARFRRQVVPGDVLEMECELTRRSGAVGIGVARALVSGQTAASAELIFSVMRDEENFEKNGLSLRQNTL